MKLYKIDSFIKYLPVLAILIFTLTILSFATTKIEIILYFSAEIISFFFGILFIKSKGARGGVWTLFCVIVGMQVCSIVNTGDYIIPLTLSNLSEFQAVGHKIAFQVSIVILSYVMLSLLIYKSELKAPKVISFLLLLSFTVINGPVHHLVSSLYQYYKQLTYKPNYNYPKIANKFLKFDFYNYQDLKDYFPSGAPKNIIVIFTEGMSAKVIDKENNLGLNITPNMDSYYSEGLVFKNYFNHTAATFRGLRGQLSSGFQYRDGVDGKGEGFFQIDNATVSKNYNNRLISLPEILKANDYNSYFIAATEVHSNLNTLMETMPFQKVYGMEDFNWHQNDRMSDKKIFSALKEVVSKQSGKPFFISIYSSGTHHGMDSPDEKYKSGKNAFYNKFFNYDYQLGQFVNWFKNSPRYNDTLLIITADHSTFPVPDFKSSFNTSSDYFVDTIPLIMIGAGVKHRTIDAYGNNSLSLAPTILQILNINNGPNYFLGCSLFDLTCSSPYSHLSVIGDDFYKIIKGKDGQYHVDTTEPQKDVVDYYNVSG
ncbi:LTA synthase family protein [Leclercia adecarboxylata]|uniref:LTA synthase family protein n=1 Tax=Leclercia adecarboxylata TaxID=83655 RepID=UPI0021F16CFF|nr:LTA synthase family protein [Leclercia adecarboxylata]UYM55193.1 LTA synthase family protein [Leclercia adecarboxylata]